MMDFLLQAIDFVLHVDQYLEVLINYFGIWTYVILFLIIFCETGLVVTPFLPGDSLLFALGVFCGKGSLEFYTLWPLLVIAAIIGDSVNYWIGHKVGPAIFNKESTRLFNKKHLVTCHNFYERHGGKTIIIARFVPIIRTFAPFVAGIGKMSYARFMSYNVIGALAWVSFFMILGYFIGNMEIVRENFSLVIYGIIVLSILPGVVEVLRERAKSRKNRAESETSSPAICSAQAVTQNEVNTK